jgi:glutamate racemase
VPINALQSRTPVDLLAGRSYAAAIMAKISPTILVFDSGLGGLTVFGPVAAARPDARFVYVADDAAFPYGRLGPDALIARVLGVMERLVAAYTPDLVVIACNTASTLVLPHLRARFAMPFVGTVPAIKPAAELSRSRMFTVLATPGTVARDYTHDLIRSYAGDCSVNLVGATRLASLAEAHLRGEPVSDADILAEIAPCFVTDGARRTDVVTLSCTHYPLLAERLAALSPWPVTWLDPAPAIARRVTALIGPCPVEHLADTPVADAVFTGSVVPAADLAAALRQRGLTPGATLDYPLQAG